MRFHPKGNKVVAVALVLSLLGAGLAGGQTTEPDWADDLFAELEGWSADYNADVDELTFVEKRLLAGQDVALRIRDEDGREVTYWFETDADARVVDIERDAGGHAVSLRLVTSKVVVDRVVAAPDPAGAIRDAVLVGEIGVKRLFVLFGTTVAVGAAEVVAGTVGVVVGAAVLVKTGLGGVVSLPKMAASRLVGKARWAFGAVQATLAAIRGFVTDVLMAVSVLDLVGVDVKGKVRAFLRVLLLPFTWIGRVIGRSTPEEEGVSERERQSPR